MALNNVSELSETPASNPDLAGISILGTGLVSTADDSFRTAASFLKKWWDDLGGVNTVAGTGDAITITTLTVYTAYKTGMRLVWIQGSANTTAVTLNLDAIGAKAVRKISGGTDVALVAGDLPAGARIEAVYSTAANAAAGGWVILSVSVASATTSAAGIVQLATAAETETGTNSTKAVTPADVAALLYAGTDNSGGATITMGDGGYFNLITSTTTITAFAFTNDAIGRTARIRFNTVRTLTYNATSLILPGARNITTAAGDIMQIRSLGSGNFVVEWYQYALSDPAITTPWVAYTPTFTGFGTAASISFFSRRVGDTLEIMGKFTTGTTTATEARITFGFNGTSANVTSDSTKIPSIRLCGSSTQNQNSPVYPILVESSVAYFTFGDEAVAAGGLGKVNGNIVASVSGIVVSIRAAVPISGW